MTDSPSMPNEAGILEALNDLEIVNQAKEHYHSVDAYQSQLLSKLRRLHHYYAPINGDQWPEDVRQRPGKLHMTVNVCKPAVDVDARLQALLPRVSQEPNGVDEESLKEAETAEKIMQRFLELSGWELWMTDFAKIKAMYGFAVLKPYWNKREKRPDVIVLENPGNLRIGWGSNDFRDIDWANYEYSISPIEVMRRFPDVEIRPNRGQRPTVLKRGNDHADPLNQKMYVTGRPQLLQRDDPYNPSEYEGQQVVCWDYWFKDVNGDVWNAIIVDGQVIAGKVNKHSELKDIPYIVVENDHEPGVPWGIATHESIIDLQIELNRLLSHAAQIVQDEIDPAWQIDADSVLDNIVPRGGEIVAAGEGKKIDVIPKSINFPPVISLIAEFKENYHDLTGLPRILFGQSPGSQTTGRALAVQVEAAANRLDFKRKRFYQGIRELLVFWSFMLEKQRLRAGGLNIGRAVSGFRRWKIIPPEITPKDVIEQTRNVIDKVNNKLISLKTGLDELGYDSPSDEQSLVIDELNNVDLNPGHVQVKMAVVQAAQSIEMQDQQAGAAQTALGNVVNQEQTLGASRMEEDNEPGPASAPGGLAPPGGPAPGSTVATALIRPTTGGQAQALNQLATQSRL